MKSYYYIFVIFILFSCKKEEKNPLIGNWYIEEQLDNDDHYDRDYLDKFSLNIINDSVLEYKYGFYESIPTKMKVLSFTRDPFFMDIEALHFLGTQTKYIIKDSVLLIKESKFNSWKEYKILSLNKVNLALETVENESKIKLNLIKKTIAYNDATQYDAIVVDRALGFGCCGINTTYINRKGKMYFKGLGYNTNEDDFTTQLDTILTHQIFKKFDKIKIFDMKDSYGRSFTDSQNNTITFIKNGKIVKSIQDYASKAPVDFYVAYNELSYVYQKVKNKSDHNFIFDNRLHFPSFENSKVQHTIYNSEFFLLELELQKGKEVNISFNAKYNLNFSYRNKGFLFDKIETDGRYYKFYYNDNTTKTIDIGYHYIESNPVLTKDRNN